MSYPAYGGLPAGTEKDLKRLAQRAIDLQGKLDRIEAAAPERAEGTDRTGAVRVVIGRDGLPESIEVDMRWRRQIRPADLASAITEASRQSVQRRGEAWAEALQESLRSGKPTGSAKPSGSAGPLASGRSYPGAAYGLQPPVPRSLDRITEDILGMFETAMSPPQPQAGPAHTRDPSASRPIIIAIERGGQVSCTADSRWIAAQEGGSEINRVLRTALAAAREELRSQSESGGAVSAAGRMPRMAEEINAATAAIIAENSPSSAARGRQA